MSIIGLVMRIIGLIMRIIGLKSEQYFFQVSVVILNYELLPTVP